VKSEPVVTPLNIDKQKLERLHHVLKTRKLTGKGRYKAIRKVTGGICSVCEGIPTMIVTYEVGDSKTGVQLIERYCDECVKKWVT
jgi:hypothetical protein